VSDLHHLTAAQQLDGLRTGQLSSRDLTTHYLDRIARLDPELGAFITVDADAALRDAARADEALGRGECPPLTGLPLGIKDLATTAGMRTSFGSAPLAGHVPAADSWTVALLRGAGAVFVGKTNTPEYGATCFTENDVVDRPAVTPYAPTRYSSGSSGGAATAVAAGLLPLAHGSDSAGSIRTPASTCHLVGIKPSRGLVSPAPGVSFLSVGTEGPLARTVEDAALLLDVMARPAPGDLYAWRAGTSFRAAARAGSDQRLRVAVWTETGLPDSDPHPAGVAAAERAARVLTELGHEVRALPIPARFDPPTKAAMEAWFATTVAFAASMIAPPDQHDLLRDYTRHLMAESAQLSAGDVLGAQAALARYAATMLGVFEDVDVVLTPTTNGPPAVLGHYAEHGVAQVTPLMLEWSCHTPWANLTGQPAIAVPAHLTDDGLPVGVQLVGRPQADAQLVALAAQLEHAGLWDDVHPPHWNQ
jgi:amidase